MRRSVLPCALLLMALAAPSGLAEVEVAIEAATPGRPSPAARACDLRLLPDATVVSECEHGCYIEAWDGPVLMVANTCTFPVWVSYVHSGPDGRSRRTPCYELRPGADAVAIPEPSMGRWADRRIVVSQEPGTRGYRTVAASPDCPAEAEVQPSTTTP